MRQGSVGAIGPRIYMDEWTDELATLVRSSGFQQDNTIANKKETPPAYGEMSGSEFSP